MAIPMDHVCGAQYPPMTQGKIERWHQTLNNRRRLSSIRNIPPADAEATYWACQEDKAIATSLERNSLLCFRGGSPDPDKLGRAICASRRSKSHPSTIAQIRAALALGTLAFGSRIHVLGTERTIPVGIRHLAPGVSECAANGLDIAAHDFDAVLTREFV